MKDTEKRLDQVRSRISESAFLENKGLSNEVGIHVFCYEPHKELMVREFIKKLKSETSAPFRIIECDLYEIFLTLLDEKNVLNKIADMEEKKGKDYLLKQLQKIASPEAMLERMKYEPVEPGKDVLFLTGLGKVYPFMRSHKMLDSMQHVFAEIPIVMFYPGEYNGQTLSLFGDFHDGNYYRAFNLI